MANQKYRVKEGCRIEHDGKPYVEGDEVELTPTLALFHAANIEVVNVAKTASAKTDLAQSR